MDRSTKDQVKGTAQVVKGKIEEVAGKLASNKKMEAHGLVDQVVGKAKQAAARVEKKIKKRMK